LNRRELKVVATPSASGEKGVSIFAHSVKPLVQVRELIPSAFSGGRTWAGSA